MSIEFCSFCYYFCVSCTCVLAVIKCACVPRMSVAYKESGWIWYLSSLRYTHFSFLPTRKKMALFSLVQTRSMELVLAPIASHVSFSQTEHTVISRFFGVGVSIGDHIRDAGEGLLSGPDARCSLRDGRCTKSIQYCANNGI